MKKMKILGVAGIILGGVATMIGDYAAEQEMKAAVSQEVSKQMEEQSNKKES